MPKKSDREPRESALARGWTVEGDAAGAAVDPPTGAPGVAGVAAAAHATEPSAENAAETAAEPLEPAPARSQLSTGALVLLGVIGGLYLVYTWVWFSWAQYTAAVVGADLEFTAGPLGAALQLMLYWIAPLAPALWFISVFVLGRGGPTWRLACWLVLGAVVLIPWPYFLWGA